MTDTATVATANARAKTPRTRGLRTIKPGQPIMSHRQIQLVLIGLMAGMFLGALDQTVVGTAIRTIGDDLNGLSQQAWVTTAYLITSTIATPIYGKLSDIFGRRPLFIIAIGIFIVGSAMSSFSQSMIMLAAFRAFQGIGAGGLMSLPMAIMGDILAPRERAKYQGYFLAVFGVSSVAGPLIGGLFAGTPEILFIHGWRWVFLINVPIGIIALIMVLIFLHLPKKPAGHPRIDWWGATAVIVALVPLLLVAEQGQTWGWSSIASISCFVLGAVGVVAFIFIERWMGEAALIPFKLFHSSTFSMATVMGFLVGFAMFGAMMTIPLYLQIVQGATPTQSGLMMLPMILGLMVASITTGQIMSRTGKYRIFPITGTFMLSGGFFYLTFLNYNSTYWFMAGAMLVIGLGLGQLMQTLIIASQNSVGARDMGVATSSATFFRQIGGTMGTAILISILFTIMPLNIQNSMSDKATLTSALDAALDPSVANASNNKPIMEKLYDPIVDGLKTNTLKVSQAGIDQAMAEGKTKGEQAATAAVQAQVQAGQIPASAAAAAEQQAAAQGGAAGQKAALAAATKAVEQKVPVARVDANGTVTLDFSNASDRSAFVSTVVPEIQKSIKKTKSTSSSSGINDTSFLNGADKRLSKPFLAGFDTSAVLLYWVSLGVALVTFILSWFFKTPPLRKTSALQEAADQQAMRAAENTGALVLPETLHVVRENEDADDDERELVLAGAPAPVAASGSLAAASAPAPLGSSPDAAPSEPGRSGLFPTSAPVDPASGPAAGAPISGTAIPVTEAPQALPQLNPVSEHPQAPAPQLNPVSAGVAVAAEAGAEQAPRRHGRRAAAAPPDTITAAVPVQAGVEQPAVERPHGRRAAAVEPDAAVSTTQHSGEQSDLGERRHSRRAADTTPDGTPNE
jgi:EmrB/QacA subfamily drug resistance transporter